MKKIFLDSSVLVAASASKRGASAYILGYCRLKKLQCFVCLDVIGEARKNINLKLGKTEKRRFIYFLKKANLKLTKEPLPKETLICKKIIEPKDASILAAAIKSPVDFLITLDKKHFFKKKVVNFSKPIKIITPGEFVLKFLRESLR